MISLLCECNLKHFYRKQYLGEKWYDIFEA